MKSMRDAINAKCKECLYDPIAHMGTWKEQVAECSSPACPLFELRPMPRRGSSYWDHSSRALPDKQPIPDGIARHDAQIMGKTKDDLF